MKERTTQDLLAERRANIQEMRTTYDYYTRMMITAHVAVIDAELRRRRKEG